MTAHDNPTAALPTTRVRQLVALFSETPATTALRAYEALDEVARDALFMLDTNQVVRRNEQHHFVFALDIDVPVAVAVQVGFLDVRWNTPEPERADDPNSLCAYPIRLTVHGTLAREELGRFLSIRDGRD